MCGTADSLNVPSSPSHVSGPQICWSVHFLSITLPQWLLSSVSAKGLSFMKKQIFCLFHRNELLKISQNCTSLGFSNNYSYSLLIDLAVHIAWWYHLNLKCSTFKYFPGVCSSLLPQYKPITWKQSVVVEQAGFPLHTYHTHCYTQAKPNISGVANMKALVPTILHLQTQDNCIHSTILLHQNHTRFYLTWRTTYF